MARTERVGTGATSSEELLYLHPGHLRPPRRASDAAGRIVWSWEGGAFGGSSAEQDPDGDGVNTLLPLRHPGQYHDAGTGFYCNWNRYYAPSTGRYIQSDLIGLAGGVNTFVYVWGNPVMKFDLYGTDDNDVRIAAKLPMERTHFRILKVEWSDFGGSEKDGSASWSSDKITLNKKHFWNVDTLNSEFFLPTYIHEVLHHNQSFIAHFWSKMTDDTDENSLHGRLDKIAWDLAEELNRPFLEEKYGPCHPDSFYEI